MALDGLRTAAAFLTRLPVPAPASFDLPAALGWFPLVGAVVGGLAAAGWAAGEWLAGPLVGAVLAVAVGIAATGALHEDGLADTADGLWGGHDRERRLAIMRDSRLGTYGALALVIVVGLQVAALSSLGVGEGVRALVVGHLLARLSLLLLIAALPPARPEGLGAGVADGPSSRGWAVAGVTVLLVGLPIAGAALLLLVPLALGVAWGLGRVALARIGGVTGDVLGAAAMAAHLTALLTVAALVRHGHLTALRIT